MNTNKTKRENFTFFNEEWNQPFWEDGADEIDQRKDNKSSLVED
jgi:hypothetical protein